MNNFFIRVYVVHEDGNDLLDVRFDECDVGSTALAAAALVRALPAMYAGDRVDVNVFLNGRTALKHGLVGHLHSTGMMGNPDETIESIAHDVEKWGC